MPRYISAYELQQSDDLIRPQVIELAERGPVLWKASDRDLLTPGLKNGFFSDGFDRLKHHALSSWLEFRKQCKLGCDIWNSFIDETLPTDDPAFFDFICGVNDEYKNYSPRREKQGPIEHNNPNYAEEWQWRRATGFCSYQLKFALQSILPPIVLGLEACNFFWSSGGDYCPDKYNLNQTMKFPIREVLDSLDFYSLLDLGDMPSRIKTENDLWIFLQHSSTHLVALFFKHIFSEKLFFDLDDPPNSKNEKIEEPAPDSDKNDSSVDSVPKKRKKAEISAKKAANALGIEERTIYRWENNGGAKAPKGYPGREIAMSFYAFAGEWKMNKAAKRELQGIRTAERSHYSGDEDDDK